MVIELQFWQAVSLLLSFFGFVAGGVKILFTMFEKRLDERFAVIERRDAGGLAHWDTRFSALERAQKEVAGEWSRIERSLLELKAELPLQYVRREDYVRGQSVLEAKIDGLAVKFENMILRSDKHG